MRENNEQVQLQNEDAAARAPVTATASGGSVLDEVPDFIRGFRENNW